MSEVELYNDKYTEYSGESGIKDNWAANYAKKTIEKHKSASPIDHPDGSVTREKIKSGAVSADKLSDDVIASIVAAQNTADSATVLANSAQQTAEQAGGIANYAVDRANEIETAANAAIKKLQEDFVNVETTATNALLAADSASNEASIGISEARAAQTTADNAQTTANTAVKNAEAANSLASTAYSYADLAYSACGREHERIDALEENMTAVSHTADSAQQRADEAFHNADSAFGTVQVLEDAVKKLELRATPFASGEVVWCYNNTFYQATEPIKHLELVYDELPDFICSLYFTLASEGDITIILPESKYIGAAPTFSNGETWELSIRNGVIVGGKVV